MIYKLYHISPHMIELAGPYIRVAFDLNKSFEFWITGKAWAINLAIYQIRQNMILRRHFCSALFFSFSQFRAKEGKV